MALPLDITLTRVSTATPTTFTALPLQPGVRYNPESGSSTPERHVFKHSTGNVAGLGIVDRRLSQYSLVKLGADGKPKTLIVNVTISEPRDGTFTADEVWDAVSFSKEMLSEARVAALRYGDS